jgi:hypothetical protein
LKRFLKVFNNFLKHLSIVFNIFTFIHCFLHSFSNLGDFRCSGRSLQIQRGFFVLNSRSLRASPISIGPEHDFTTNSGEPVWLVYQTDLLTSTLLFESFFNHRIINIIYFPVHRFGCPVGKNGILRACFS